MLRCSLNFDLFIENEEDIIDVVTNTNDRREISWCVKAPIVPQTFKAVTCKDGFVIHTLIDSSIHVKGGNKRMESSDGKVVGHVNLVSGDVSFKFYDKTELPDTINITYNTFSFVLQVV